MAQVVVAICPNQACEHAGKRHVYALDYLENEEPRCGACGEPLAVTSEDLKDEPA